jgi:hypothetical protein
MQVAVVDSGRQVGSHSLDRTAAARRGAVAGVAEISPIGAAREVAGEERGSGFAPMRGGLRSLDTQFNQRVAASQRTIEFLRRVDTQLQTLRTAIATQLGAGRNKVDDGATAELASQIQRFDKLWRERNAATGGALDNRLDQVEPGTAEQRFKVRGLTIDSLTKGDTETLYLAVGGRTERAAAVTIEPGLDAAEIVKRFHRALAPNGVRVSLDRQGELVFSVRETEWNGGRDLLAVKGDGRRFPTGPFTAVRIVPEESIIRPQEWSVDGPTALRDTLDKVIDAQNTVRHAQQLATEALEEEGRELVARSQESEGQEGAWCADFARTFATAATRHDYRTLSALSSALLGVSRDRVQALLTAS